MFIPTLEKEPDSGKDEQITVFISYAREDSEAAERLYNDLKSAGLLPWMDRPSPRTGETWGVAIRKAIRNSRYFIPLFSSKSEAFERRRSLQTDFKYAMNIFKTLPENKVYIIPARLDDCNIPESLKIQYVDLFPDWNKGLNKIFAIVKKDVSEFEFAIEEGDITASCSDVIARLYAQHFYGDDMVVKILEEEGITIDSLRPLPDKYCYVETAGLIKARFVLFVGVPQQFTYKEIREFAARVIDIVSKEMFHAEHIAMTIHGPGMGLDEIESLLAQFGGVQDTMLTKGTSSSIKRISIVDRNHERVQRLRNALQKNLASINYAHELKPDGSLYRISIGKIHRHRVIYGDVTKEINTMPDTPDSINSAGSGSESKPFVFVAMPFRKEMEDVFYFGIQEPSHSADLLCERIDNEAFTGDVLTQVKQKIETAAVVIADLTGGNPNVYLEIGYAWGKGRPTILLVRDKEEVKFDVRGQRYLKYETIKGLQDALRNELKELKSKGLI